MSSHPTLDLNLVRDSLKRQYHAALAMLREAVELCPDELWLDATPRNACWQHAYHVLFYTHFYMMDTPDDFVPWVEHQAQVQNPDGIPGPPDPNSELPHMPTPYTREQVLAYCEFCDTRVDERVNDMDLASSESGFFWYPIPKLEHQLVNIRHIQHHAAQIADRLRNTCDLGVNWAGSRKRPSNSAE